MTQMGVKLIGKFVAGSPRSCSKWTTRLNHKVGDDSVKREPIVVGFSCVPFPGTWLLPTFGARGKADKVRDCFRHEGFMQLGNDGALGSDEYGPGLSSSLYGRGFRDSRPGTWGCFGICAGSRSRLGGGDSSCGPACWLGCWSMSKRYRTENQRDSKEERPSGCIAVRTKSLREKIVKLTHPHLKCCKGGVVTVVELFEDVESLQPRCGAGILLRLGSFLYHRGVGLARSLFACRKLDRFDCLLLWKMKTGRSWEHPIAPASTHCLMQWNETKPRMG